MSIFDTQTAVCTFRGVTISPERLEVGLDRSWAPYAQGEVVLPGILDIDPDTPGRVAVVLEQWFAMGRTAQQIADLFAGDSAAVIAAAAGWAGRTGLLVAQQYMVNMNGTYMPPTRARFDLLVREAAVDLDDRRTTLTVASDEAVLIDAGLVEASPVTFGSLSVRTIVTQVLARYGYALVAGAADGMLEEAAVWMPGQPAWDFLEPLIQQAGLRLWCDEHRLWRLDNADTSLPGQVTLATTRGVSGARPTVDREQGGYDSVVVEYQWTDVNGVQQTRWDVAGASQARKTRKIVHDGTPYPGPGAATILLRRWQKRRRKAPIDAASNYHTRPTMRLALVSTALPVLSGRVQSVRFAFPERTMHVEAYDFEAENPQSTRAIPATYQTDQLPGTTASLTPGSM